MTLTIEIEEIKRKSLEKIAAENGKKTGEFVSDIIDDFLRQNQSENESLKNLMKLSETFFSEWDNEEDAVYDNL